MELQQLVLRAQEGDNAAYEAVCRRFQGLVKKLARQRHLAGIYEEAEGEGWLALAQAVKEYSPERCVPFAGYAERCVGYRLWNVFKKERRRWQNECPLESGQSSEDGDNAGIGLLYRIEAAEDVAGEVERREKRDELRTALESLPDRQRQAVMTTIIGSGKLADLASDWGVSIQAVHATRKKALLQLKQSLLHRL